MLMSQLFIMFMLKMGGLITLLFLVSVVIKTRLRSKGVLPKTIEVVKPKSVGVMGFIQAYGLLYKAAKHWVAAPTKPNKASVRTKKSQSKKGV